MRSVRRKEGRKKGRPRTRELTFGRLSNTISRGESSGDELIFRESFGGKAESCGRGWA